MTKNTKNVIGFILIIVLISIFFRTTQNTDLREDKQTTTDIPITGTESEINCNRKDTCNILINKPFIISEEYGTNLMITGGCLLDRILYDEEYVRKIETKTEYIDDNRDYFTTYHRFMPIKEGTTIMTTEGSCEYNRNITLHISAP